MRPRPTFTDDRVVLTEQERRDYETHVGLCRELAVEPDSPEDWAYQRRTLFFGVVTPEEQIRWRVARLLPRAEHVLEALDSEGHPIPAEEHERIVALYAEHRRERVQRGDDPLPGLEWLRVAGEPVAGFLARARAAGSERRRQQRILARLHLLQESGIARRLTPRALELIATEGHEETHAARTVARWLDKERRPPVLVLLGAPGLGKTLAIGLALATRGGAYAKARDLAGLSLASFGDDATRFRKLLDAPLLAVDEVGADGRRDERVALHEVIDERLSVGPTIIASNLDEGTFGEHVDARTADRIREVGVLVTVRGASLRGTDREVYAVDPWFAEQLARSHE